MVPFELPSQYAAVSASSGRSKLSSQQHALQCSKCATPDSLCSGSVRTRRMRFNRQTPPFMHWSDLIEIPIEISEGSIHPPALQPDEKTRLLGMLSR